MSNVVIVGSGPAGISAALYTVRAGLNTTVIRAAPARFPKRTPLKIITVLLFRFPAKRSKCPVLNRRAVWVRASSK